MKIKLIYACAPLICVLLACGKNEKRDHGAHARHDHEASDPRAAGVMAIHDSIMPRMGEIVDLTEKLEIQLHHTDSLLVQTQSKALIHKLKNIESVLGELQRADKAMMEWMHAYEPDTLKNMNDEMAEHYLKKQKEAILQIKSAMEESITHARQIISAKNQVDPKGL